MYLLDTNVVSEARKGLRMNAGVRDFLASVDPVTLFLPVQVIGEIRAGIARLQRRGDRDQAARLDAWLGELLGQHRGRVLDFDADCAQAWGQLMVADEGRVVDRQIAAIAGIHRLTVVTRNGRDFAGSGVPVLDPFLP